MGCVQADMTSASIGSLTHVDEAGQANMVDVGQKPVTQRTASATGRVLLGPQTFALVAANKLKKGDVLNVAKLAGIMGAKQTSLLIPLCHNIVLNKVDLRISLVPEHQALDLSAEARACGQTGVEMEALTAVAVAALTVYDMCKAVSKEICITDIQLESKSGGQTGTYSRAPVISKAVDN